MRCIRDIRGCGLTVFLPLVKSTRSRRGTVHLDHGAPSGLIGTLRIRRLRSGFGFGLSWGLSWGAGLFRWGVRIPRGPGQGSEAPPHMLRTLCQALVFERLHLQGLPGTLAKHMSASACFNCTGNAYPVPLIAAALYPLLDSIRHCVGDVPAGPIRRPPTPI